jgi:hypothetical protein
MAVAIVRLATFGDVCDLAPPVVACDVWREVMRPACDLAPPMGDAQRG